MAQTKEQQRRHLGLTEAKIGTLRDRIEELEKALEFKRKRIHELKDVARFYRGQRDRIDGYLSGVLDMVRQYGVGHGSGDFPMGAQAAPIEALRDVVRSAEHMIETQVDKRYSARPRVHEPDVTSFNDEGRGYAAYRDAEPAPYWEDF